MIPAEAVEAAAVWAWRGGAVEWVGNEAQHYCYINIRSAS